MRNHRNFITALAEAVPGDTSPLIFRKWAAISTIAGALGRKAYFERGTYRLRPNLFICLVGDSGIGKTQALSLGFGKVFSYLIAPFTSDSEIQEEYKRVWSRYITPPSKPLRFINERITGPQLEVRMSQISEPVDMMQENSFDHVEYEAPLTLITREFGVLVSRTNETLHTFLTDVWDCNPTAGSDLKTGGTHIVRGPCLNWISCAVPTEFTRNMPENAQEQGLLSRIIPVYYTGERPLQDLWYGECSKSKLDLLREDLGAIAMMRGNFDFDCIQTMEFVRADIQSDIKPIPTDPKMKEYNSRRHAHLLKIAMCVAAAKHNELVITKEDWLEARAYLLEAEKFMPKVLASFGVRDAGQTTDKFYNHVRDYCRLNNKSFIPVTAAKRFILSIVRHPSEINNVIDAAISAGTIMWADDTKKGLRWIGDGAPTT